MIASKNIQLVSLKDVKLNPKNRNRHDKDQIERLIKIIEYQGFRSPLIISNRTQMLVAGHGRLQAAKKMKLKQVPVMYQDFTDEAQEYACMVSDNAIASWSELDMSAINTDIGDLGPDFDIDLLGIKGFEIDVADKELGDEEAMPEHVEPRTKLGDIYALGDHRLMCGDSTSIDAVEKLMNGERADITFNSPPYNLGDNAKLRGHNGDGKDSAYRTKSDHKSSDDYLEFLKQFTTNAMTVSDIVFCNIQCLAGNKLIVPDYWHHFKENLVDIMIWDKVHAPPQMAEHVLNSVWEFIFAFTLDSNTSRSIDTGKRFRGNIDNIYRLNPNGKKDPLAKDHRAVFPVAFAEHFAEHFADKSIVDLFGGSGTTMIAAEKLNKKSYLMELDPHYCDVIVKRWENYTGKKAELIGQTS